MKEVMKHIADDTIQLHLVRYHNTQALEKLREVSTYVHMLLARSENPDSKHITTTEVNLISSKAEVVREHLLNAENFTHAIAKEKSQEMMAQTIAETDSLTMGTNSVVGIRKKEG